MNYAESFEQFASKVGPMDLALYAGAGIVLWVLFKEKLSPVQKLLTSLFDRLKTSLPAQTAKPALVEHPVIEAPVVLITDEESKEEDIFFKLIASWKRTRDLAVKSRCVEAVKVADQMFPYLSPIGCDKEDKVSKT